MSLPRPDLSFATLRAAYRAGTLTPLAMVEQLDARLRAEEALCERHLWIRRLSLGENGPELAIGHTGVR